MSRKAKRRSPEEIEEECVRQAIDYVEEIGVVAPDYADYLMRIRDEVLIRLEEALAEREETPAHEETPTP